MKIIAIPATLRIMVDDSISDEDAHKLALATCADTNPMIEPGNIEAYVKRQIGVESNALPNLVGEVDLWVDEEQKSYTIHNA